MATNKNMELEYIARKGEKTTDSNISRRAQKSKVLEHTESSQKKQTRAKTRVAVSDDTTAQSSINKIREKGRTAVDITKDGDSNILSKKDTENLTPPKKDSETVGPPKNLPSTVAPKKDVIGTGSVKKDMVSGILKKDTVPSFTVKKVASGPGLPKNGESIGVPKKDILSLATSRKDEASVGKSRKFKIKIPSNVVPEKKREDRLNPSKSEEHKSEVTTSVKSKNKDDKLKADRRENGSSLKADNEKNHEIMNSDVTSSMDEKLASGSARNYPPAVAIACLTKDLGWSPGDLAWGRVGQHPFWPCIIAVDHMTGIYTKTKRVGRGVNSYQQSLHVQFFGDNGRHSWIPTSCVIKYDGPDQFHKFAEKVLNEMKKKDKRYSSAFHVKPSSKLKWETAILEAEASVPKAREDRIQFFQDLLPKRKKTEKVLGYKNIENGTKSSVQLVKKRNNKRPNPNTVETPAKQIKIDRKVAMKGGDISKKPEGAVTNAPNRKKRGRNKN